MDEWRVRRARRGLRRGDVRERVATYLHAVVAHAIYGVVRADRHAPVVVMEVVLPTARSSASARCCEMSTIEFGAAAAATRCY